MTRAHRFADDPPGNGRHEHQPRVVAATPEQVWDVLSDGWLYPLWVVGASRMREVDDHWPEVGARLHHSVGSWPLLIDDTTEVLDASPSSMLRLRARAWPAGRGRGDPPPDAGRHGHRGDDRGAGHVRARRRCVPGSVQDPPLAWRNVESLRRLAYVAERRQ